MSKGRGGHVRRKYYAEMVADEGEYCKVCKRCPPEVYLEIDHKDRNPNNNARSNRQFLCRPDNRKKNPRGKGKRKNREAYDPTVILQPVPTSWEAKRNSISEPKYRHWLDEKVRKHGRIPVKMAKFSGAEYAGCSPITAERYLMKACSDEGLFQIVDDKILKEKVVVFRDPSAVDISIALIEESEAK